MNTLTKINNYSNFQNLLKVAQTVEKVAMEKIKLLYDVEIINIQNTTNYKFMLHDFETSNNLKYEVKADYASEITNNFFCEFIDDWGKLSGISISDANFYIILSCDVYYLIPIEKLKELTFNKRVVRNKNSGKGYLIPMIQIKENSIII